MGKEERTLTAAEERRLKKFDKKCAELEEQGYTKNVLTIDLKKANTIISLVAIPVFLLSMILYWAINGIDGFRTGTAGFLVSMVVMLILIVVHELLHGLGWSLYCENGWKDIEFGFIVKTMNPYCTCATPLEKPFYIIGALLPLIVLGIVPYIAGLFMADIRVFLLGTIMILSAGGDIMLVWKLLKFRTDASEVLVYDHPTEAGSVVFTK